MVKQERRLFVIYGLALVVLYLVSSTDLFIKEKKVEIYPVSVIVEDTKDEYYQNFRRGVDQAAKEYHVDTTFITLDDCNSERQQLEVLYRELSDGAKAVVMVPVKAGNLLPALEDIKAVAAVVLYGSLEGGEKISASIFSMDYSVAGKKLGEAFVRQNGTDCLVYFFTEGLEYQSNLLFYQGIMEVLEPLGYRAELFTKNSEDTFGDVMEQVVYPGSEKMAVIALDSRSLSTVADILKKSSVYRESVTGLYGIGSTLSILNALDTDMITGTVVCNQYLAGYRTIQKAVEAIRKGNIQERVSLESFYIERKDLRDKQYEKMLYPME